MRTLSLTLLLALTIPVAAAPSLEVVQSGAALQVRNAPATRAIRLRVAGKEVNLSSSFKSMADVTLPARDAEGEPLPDGVYRYELTLWPQEAAAVKANKSEAKPVRVTGVYRINFGMVAADSGLRSTVKADDVVQSDNLIVTSPSCIGSGCADGELFADEDLRLKSSYPWLRFEDTSVSAAGHDWQIQIGDKPSANAIERFSIQDLTANTIPFTIEGSAPTNSLYVGDNGKVGIGTSTPESNLEVRGGTLGLSGGYPYYDWKLSGSASFFLSHDEFGSLKSPLVVENAPSHSLHVRYDGKVGMGTNVPSERLHVLDNSNANSLLMIENPNNGTAAVAVLRAKSDSATVNFQAHGSGRTITRFGTSLGAWNEFLSVSGNGLAIGTLAATPLILGTNSANRLTILGNGNIGLGVAAPVHPLQTSTGAYLSSGGTWMNASSRELKTNIQELSAGEADAALKALRPVTFEYNAEKGESYAGFIAEDVPALVASKQRDSLSPMDIVAVLTRVTQEQQRQLEQQNERLAQQQKTVEELATEVRALRAMLPAGGN